MGHTVNKRAALVTIELDSRTKIKNIQLLKKKNRNRII